MMRVIFIIGLFLANSFLKAQKPASVDVLHYNFYIMLHANDDVIEGKASIQLKTITEGLVLLNFENKILTNSKGMEVEKLFVDSIACAFTHDKKILTIQKNCEANKIYTIQIVYKGIPSNGLIISKNKYGHRTYFGDNWPNRAQCWLPCKDDVADKATVTFTVNAPNDFEIISNGVLEKETIVDGRRTSTYYSAVPIPTKVMVIGAAHFAHKLEAKVQDSIPIYSYLYPEDSVNGYKDYGKAIKIIKWFITNVGPYNYKKLANVQSTTMFGGMENASAIFYNENEISGTYANEDLIAHEIAHQWFGNTVTEKSYAHLWLSEGFATYFASLYMKDTYGAEVFKNRLLDERKQVLHANVSGPVINTSTEYMSLLNAYSYQKGAWVLYMLHTKIGDEKFFKVIKNYYANYRNKNADSDDFIKEVENVVGTKMEDFFYPFLKVKENPSLEMSYKYNKLKKSIDIKVKQLTDYVFRLPVKILVENGNKKEYHNFFINDKIGTYSIPLSLVPKNIIIDPNDELLASIKIKKQPL